MKYTVEAKCTTPNCQWCDGQWSSTALTYTCKVQAALTAAEWSLNAVGRFIYRVTQ